MVTLVIALSVYVLVYDADCSMCTRFKDMIDFLDADENFGFMSIDDAERIGLLDSLPDVRRHRSFHIVRPDDLVESGAEAVPTLVSLLPLGRLVSKIITSAPLGRQMISFLYTMVSRRHEAGLCKLPTANSSNTIELDNHGKRTKVRIRRSSRRLEFGRSVY